MRRCIPIAGAALALALTGCDALEDDALAELGESGARPGPWVELASARFHEDGESETVTIPDQGLVDAIALRVTSDPEVCFQLSSVVDGLGRAVVAGRSAGAYCRECELRSSLVASAGLYVLPVEAGRFEPDTGLSLRFARLDCLTLTPLASPEDQPPLQVELQRILAVPERAVVKLRLIVGANSILYGDEPRLHELEEALEEELASAGITPRIVALKELDEWPDELRFHAGDHAALAAALSGLPPKAETTVDVVVGGCLLYDDPIFGPPSPVKGYTPRIPGGAGPADAVFLPGLDCLAAGPGSEDVPEDIPVAAQARVLAHELGHYLGLYHAVEVEGGADQFEDTSPDNIMHHNPERAEATGFSPSQGLVMRAHPSVHAPRRQE